MRSWIRADLDEPRDPNLLNGDKSDPGSVTIRGARYE